MEPKSNSGKWLIKRKEQGLCPKCGKPIDREGWYCAACLEKANRERKETRDWRRKNHLCTECGKERVYGTDKICFECRAKYNNRRKPLTDSTKAKMRTRERNLYQERKATGICVRCGKRKAEGGKVKCYACLKKDAEIHRAKWLELKG